jgi:hypothetical protein
MNRVVLGYRRLGRLRLCKTALGAAGSNAEALIAPERQKTQKGRSNKRGITFCQATRSSAFFLCVATNDIAWATSYLVEARSGAPGT